MPIDEALREQVRARLSEVDEIVEKPIVGGIGFTLRGNLLCGVMGEDLLVHVAKTEFGRYVAEPGARPMVMAGRSSRSWILVGKGVVSSRGELARWIDRAIQFVSTLPAK